MTSNTKASIRERINLMMEAKLNEFKIKNGKPVGPIDPRKQMQRDAHDKFHEIHADLNDIDDAEDMIADHLHSKYFKTFGHTDDYINIAKEVVDKYR